MRFVRIDKQTGSGAPTQNRYAYLLPLSTVEYFPEVAPDGVRLLGDIVTSVGSWAIPVYLTSSSQEFSYETLGNADEESYLVKFTGTHPGTELEALSFAQNMVGEHFLILIPNCDKNQPWKVLGEYTNPLIFTSSHRAGRNGSVFTFNFEQAIPSEYIYFSYDGVVVLPEGDPTPDPDDPGHGFDPTKWARRNAENIDGDNVLPWRIALDIYSKKQVDDRIAALLPDRVLTIGAVTATANKAYLALPVEGKNEVTIDGTSYARNVAQTFPFTPVATHLKVVIIEAKPDAQVFHLVEGEEGPQAKEPTYTGLFVARLIISPEGVIVEQGESGVKNISEDGWRVVPFVDTETFIEIGENPASKFEFTSDSTSDVSFCGIIVTEGKNNWQGKTYWLKNSGTASIDLQNYDVPVPANKKLFTFENIAPTLSLKPKGWAIAVVKGNMLTVVAMGSGDIDLTPYATNARVDAVQAEVDAETVNRAAADLLKMDKPLAPNNTPYRVILADGTTKLLSEIVPSGAYIPKGSVANFAALPTTGNLEGHVYNLLDTGDNYVWVLNLNNTGNPGWDKLSGTVDLTNYYTKSESDTKNTSQDNAIADLYIGQAKITTTISITTNTLSTTSNLKQNGRNVLIANGVKAINITCEITSEATFQAIYHKLGSANVTFVAGAGATLVQIDGTAVMTGVAGFQTASLHRDGNTFYLQISNR